MRKIALLILLTNVIKADPIGICLHAYSPEAPDDKIESIEFEKIEKDHQGTWVFPKNKRAVLITKYRFRGIISYKGEITPEHPDFNKHLKYYEACAKKIPSTRQFLNPKIILLREMSSRYAKQKETFEKLPKIVLGNKEIAEPKFIKIDNGYLYIAHANGNTKISLDLISESKIAELKKIDSSFNKFKTYLIDGRILWNPKYSNFKEGIVTIIHEKGEFKKSFKDLTDEDVNTISSWSDGTWKIAEPGFYGYDQESSTYEELVLDNGKYYKNVVIAERINADVVLQNSNDDIHFGIANLLEFQGISSKDKEKIDAWVDEMIAEKFETAKTIENSEVVSENIFPKHGLIVTDVTAKVLQVHDDGFLASGFEGNIHKGTRRVRVTKKKKINHPITNEEISKVVSSEILNYDIMEFVTDDLCYIVGNTANIVDGDFVKAKSMRLDGRFQYTNLVGAKRSVRKYQID